MDHTTEKTGQPSQIRLRVFSPDEDNNIDDVWKQFMVTTPTSEEANLNSSAALGANDPKTPNKAGMEVKMSHTHEQQPGTMLLGLHIYNELEDALRDDGQRLHANNPDCTFVPMNSGGGLASGDEELPTFEEDASGACARGEGAFVANDFESAAAGIDASRDSPTMPGTGTECDESQCNATMASNMAHGDTSAVMADRLGHDGAACGVTVVSTMTVTNDMNTGIDLGICSNNSSINDNLADMPMFDADNQFQTEVHAGADFLPSDLETVGSINDGNSLGGTADSITGFADSSHVGMPNSLAFVSRFPCKNNTAAGNQASVTKFPPAQPGNDNPNLLAIDASAPSNCTSEAISDSIAHAYNFTPTVTRHPAWPPPSDTHTQRAPLIQGFGPPVPGMLAGPRSIVDMTSDLHMSIMTSDVSRIQHLIREGASRHMELYTGHDALYWAEHKSEDTVTRALFCNLDVANHGVSHLMHAMRRNRKHIVATLLALGVKQVLQACDAGQAVFTVATFVSTPEMLQALLLHGPAVRVYKFEDLLVSCAMLANRERNALVIRHFARLQRDQLLSVGAVSCTLFSSQVPVNGLLSFDGESAD